MNTVMVPASEVSESSFSLIRPPSVMENVVDHPVAFTDDLKASFEIFRRKWWLIALSMLLSIAGGTAFVFMSTPRYEASTMLVIDPRKPVVVDAPEVLSDVAPDTYVIDTQVLLVQSRAVLTKAAERLGIGAEAEHLGLATGLSSDDAGLVNEVVDALREGLSVTRVGLSSAIKVAYADTDPAHAAHVANVISDSYITYQTELKQVATREASGWLQQRVRELQEQVQAADAAIEQYRSRSGLLLAKGPSSTESQLTSVDSGLNQARESLSDAQARLEGYQRALKSAGPAEAAKIVASPAMQQLRGQHAALENQRAQLSSTFGPSHPQMVEIARQLRTIDDQMSAEAGRTVDELKYEVTVAENRVNGLRGVRDESRLLVARDNAAAVSLSQLQAKAMSLRSLYEGMLTRLQQTTAQEGLGRFNATIVSDAIAPAEAASPNRRAVFAIASLVGLAMGALLVLLSHLFDRTIRSPAELERSSRLPVLALVPKLGRNDLQDRGKGISITDMVPSKPLSQFSEAFRALRVTLLKRARREESFVIQVTSGTFAEGKTVSSIAMAQAAAIDGRRVLLVDGDVRRRRLTRDLGIEVQSGLMEVLAGKASLKDVIVAGGANRRPHILPLSNVDPGPQDRFASEQFDTLLASLKRGFDLIIIDTAPVLAVAESLTIATRVDSVVLVAKWASTSRETLMKAAEELQRVGASVAGTVLTHVDVKSLANQAYGRRHYPALLEYYQR